MQTYKPISNILKELSVLAYLNAIGFSQTLIGLNIPVTIISMEKKN